MGSQRFDLTVRGRHHAVTASDVGLRREVVWLVDGAEVARRTTMDDRFHLDADGHGRVELRAGLLGLRRATLHADGEVVDLTPCAGFVGGAARGADPASPPPLCRAADARGRRQGRRATWLGLGLVLRWLPDWDLPRLPWPDLDLPRISWPDLPPIPWRRPPLAGLVAPGLGQGGPPRASSTSGRCCWPSASRSPRCVAAGCTTSDGRGGRASPSPCCGPRLAADLRAHLTSVVAKSLSDQGHIGPWLSPRVFAGRGLVCTLPGRVPIMALALSP